MMVFYFFAIISPSNQERFVFLVPETSPEGNSQIVLKTENCRSVYFYHILDFEHLPFLVLFLHHSGGNTV